MPNIIGKRFTFLIISALSVIAAVVCIAVFGLSPGIDFSSGSLTVLSFEQPVDQTAMANRLSELGYGNAVLQRTSEGYYSIRTDALSDAQLKQLETSLGETFGTPTERAFYLVKPSIAQKTARAAAIGIGIAALGMLIFVTLAFRKMPKPFLWGTCAIIALLHDIVVVIGIFAVLGALFHWDVDLMFVTGILAVLGNSINNIVVIFDRTRENLGRGVSRDFREVVNVSIVQTLTRSINSSLAAVIVTLALLLLLGGDIQGLLVVLFMGTAVGTFSSLFVAPTLLVVWEQGEWGSFFGKKTAEVKKIEA